LAALPSQPLRGAAAALLGVPIAAGFLGGWLLGRRGETGWAGLLGAAILAGPVAGALLLAAGRASSGGLGSGRLADLGPSGWGVGLLAAGVVTVGALVGAIAGRSLKRESVPE
jgi:hypothetical protein